MSKSKIEELAGILQSANIVEFFHQGVYYEIFASADSGYVVNLYSSDERDDEGELIESNMIDGGLCHGNAKDAVIFMI